MENPNGISPIKMVFNMLNQIIGIGVICYHFNFYKVGIIPCIILSIIYGYLTSYSAHLVIKSSLITKKTAWGDIVMDLFGVSQFLIFNVILVFACIVFGSSYLTAAADWIATCLEQWGLIKSTDINTVIILIVSSSISLVASFVRV